MKSFIPYVIGTLIGAGFCAAILVVKPKLQLKEQKQQLQECKIQLINSKLEMREKLFEKFACKNNQNNSDLLKLLDEIKNLEKEVYEMSKIK